MKETEARLKQLKRAELFILHLDSAEISFVFCLASSWCRFRTKKKIKKGNPNSPDIADLLFLSVQLGSLGSFS